MAERRRAAGTQGFEDLLDAALAGGTWAWERLYDLTAPSVLGYLRARGVPDAEDVAVDVFIAAIGAASGFEGDARAFRAWLITIAHHRAVDHLRRVSRTPGAAADADIEAAAPTGDVEQEALGRLEAGHALAAIRRLPPLQRDVLLLRLVSDLSVEEVAGIVGRSPGAVRALQHRGLARVRREISGEGVTT